MAFWNVAGLSNKDKKFWESLKNWDMIVLSETWAEEDGWKRIRDKFPGEFIWG